MSDAGYDEGYVACPNFWGDKPAEMVARIIERFKGAAAKRAIDVGCGDGKNAAALAEAGFNVLAIDASELAIANAIKRYPNHGISWLVTDLRSIRGPADLYDVVIATGSLHCLASQQEITAALQVIQHMTKPGGMNAISAFDDGPQDMSGHGPHFRPTFAPHHLYASAYVDWQVLEASSEIQADVHPHNTIEHSHSITRVLARKPMVGRAGGQGA